MFDFLKNIFGKNSTCESSNCCGGNSCNSIIDIKNDLNLTEKDLDIISKLDSKIVIGKVQELSDHSDPKITKVKVSKTEIAPGVVEQVLCGGVNLKVGDTVAVATVGAKLSEDFEIGVRKIRGEESRGMICARSELGLSPADEEKGQIWQLPEDYQMLLGKSLKDL